MNWEVMLKKSKPTGFRLPPPRPHLAQAMLKVLFSKVVKDHYLYKYLVTHIEQRRVFFAFCRLLSDVLYRFIYVWGKHFR